MYNGSPCLSSSSSSLLAPRPVTSVMGTNILDSLSSNRVSLTPVSMASLTLTQHRESARGLGRRDSAVIQAASGQCLHQYTLCGPIVLMSSKKGAKLMRQITRPRYCYTKLTLCFPPSGFKVRLPQCIGVRRAKLGHRRCL